MDHIPAFHQWLKQRRKALDLTQDELAEQVGCAVETIRKLEAGGRRPSKQIASRLAEALTRSPEEGAAFVQLARGIAPADAGHEAEERQPPVVVEQRSTNLPAPLTSFIGRERETAEVRERLATSRLVTLIGPPGIGKTRVSLHVAAAMHAALADGTFFVALASIRDPALVVSSIAQVLDVQEGASQPVIEALVAYLRTKQVLLVLDNFEQVVEAAPLLGELLARCPHLTILSTSRIPLQVYGEHEYAVPPLAVPDDGQPLPPVQDLMAYDAVRLFAERAQAVTFGFAVTETNAQAVSSICRRLDGVPLAIELAAARSKIFPPQALLARLTEGPSGRLRVLTGGARDLPTRHQTLRDAITWSHDLLNSEEQGLFRWLGVFAGGWTVEAAEVVCAPQDDAARDVLDALASLVNHSLVQQMEGVDGKPRFTMLEMIREYAYERLKTRGEADAVQQRHAAYYLAVAEQAAPRLRGPHQLTYLDQVAEEYDNLRTALAWCQERNREVGVRLAIALTTFWDARGYWSEGRRWLQRALQHSASAPSSVRAPLLLSAGKLAFNQGDYTQATAQVSESLDLFQALDNAHGSAHALRVLAYIAGRHGDYPQEHDLHTQSLTLFQHLNDTEQIVTTLCRLGAIARVQGHDQRAIQLYAESLTLARASGSKRGIAATLAGMAQVLLAQGHLSRARELLAESMALAHELGEKGNHIAALINLGDVARMQGNDTQAIAYLEESLALARQLGNKPSMATALQSLGYVAHHQHQDAWAMTLLQESLQLSHDMGYVEGIAFCLAGIASVAGAHGQPERAARLFGAVEMLLTTIGAHMDAADRADYDCAVVMTQATLDAATFTAAWMKGQAMTLAQAIAEARGEPR